MRCPTSASPIARRNKIDEAEKYFMKAIELKPDQAEFHFNLGGGLPPAAEGQGGDRRVREGDQARRAAGAGALRSRRAATSNEKRNDDAIREWNLYLDLIATQNPKEAEIVRKHITELGGKPSL